jgi:uncharacterized DUF497 family protein
MDDVRFGLFVWSAAKERLNMERHGLGFVEASLAFADSGRLIIKDLGHSQFEERFYCIGRAGENILTVRYTVRGHLIRIIGAGRWRKGRKFYEEKARS